MTCQQSACKVYKSSLSESHHPQVSASWEKAINHGCELYMKQGPVSQPLGFHQSWKRIFSHPFTQMAGKYLDITPYATPGHYRMLSLHNLRIFSNFDIFELEELPKSDVEHIPGYTAVSYVWQGINVDDDLPSCQRANSKGYFVVKGEGQTGGPISIALIMDIAWASLRQSSTSGRGPDRFLWLDQFCIMQTSKEDKAWQISRMYTIYRQSRCLVLPGGLTRLASLDDVTYWMSRAWTLQEVLAPPFILNADVDTGVLFMNDSRAQRYVHDVDKKEWGDTPYLTDGIIACAPLIALLDVLRPLGQPIFGFREEQLKVLDGAMNKTLDSSKTWIWRSAFSRTSSRPVDMIFSIMQCFDVTLNPREFNKNDRVGATIALAKAILEKPAGRAYWIPALYFLPPAPELSIFPQFPETRVDGAAVISMPNGTTKDVVDLLSDQNIVNLTNPSHVAHAFEWDGSEKMRSSGYYSFVAREIHTLDSVLDIQSLNSCTCVFQAGDGSKWIVTETARCATGITVQDENAVGYSEEYFPDAHDIEGDVIAVFIGNNGPKHVYMLARKHGPQRFMTLRSVRINIGPFPATDNNNIE